ncbi:divalent metal cation transporter MntH [Kineosporia sp. NBRC 101677]|uniref:Nramp family divalent metal transporter n=1 Tax=Kineosporia sp. NBRC 101677 TaxID=3032197 RepID=UPI0024A601A3|nr:Nramp family divalent metal transporter [Kineosporia sp. NBRC 101677]GLY17638.1 divalent metal cation transporter MntH [Kineosporia sp. NBRC 101677]
MNPPLATPTTVHAGVQATGVRENSTGRRAVGTTLGSALVAAVAYIDPGNFATNVSAGAQYGTMLVWVVVGASAVGMLVQYLSAKLGLVTGRSLPEQCKRHLSRPARIGLWLQAELVVVMTDLAEIVGGAIALNLLFGVPLLPGALIMVVAAFVILALHIRGRDAFRPVVYVCFAVVAAGFLYQAFLADLGGAELASGFQPRLEGTDSAYLAAGIVGATVMPHVVYLHSHLTKGEALISRRSMPRLIRITRREIVGAMLLAATVNISIMLAATVLAPTDTLEGAHAGFADLTGELSSWVFASALLASSLASTCVGVYSGQTIMAGFLHRSVSLRVRRAISVLPSLVILAVGVDPTAALVLSQVVLSFGIPFALAPLIWFTSRRAVMGESRNRMSTVVVATIVLGAVVALNVFLLGTLFLG